MKNTPKRSQRTPRGRERKWIASLVAQQVALGRTPKEIAEKYGITIRFCNELIEAADEEFRRIGSESVDLVRGRELAKLDDIQTKALEAYEESKRKKLVRQREMRGAAAQQGAAGNRVQRLVETEEERLADVRCLDVLVKIGERRAKLQGLDQPIEMKHVLQKAQDMREKIIRVLTEEITDPDMLTRVATRLQEIDAEDRLA